MDSTQLLSSLAQPAENRIVLLVLDGVGDLRTKDQPRTALDAAETPNLDRLAAGSSLGRLTPVLHGVTPGSGPGHLGLFGYDPALPQHDIGRGVLEALGLGLALKPTTVAARGNFATADGDGNLTDRRAGRPTTEECQRLCAALGEGVVPPQGLEVRFVPGEGHRFVLLLDGEELSAAIEDTDPQRLGVPPLAPTASATAGAATAVLVGELLQSIEGVLQSEPQANRALLRGFSKLPQLQSLEELYGLRAGAFAGYPLYRGVASACGMDVVPTSKQFEGIPPTLAEHWDRFDFFFVHVKQTDAAGEDGDLAAKVEVLETVDRHLGDLLTLAPDVLAITGDHSTPAPMRGHSWHPVPLLVSAPNAYVDGTTAFSEEAAIGGHLGTLPSKDLLGILLAHAGRLAKFGA